MQEQLSPWGPHESSTTSQPHCRGSPAHPSRKPVPCLVCLPGASARDGGSLGAVAGRARQSYAAAPWAHTFLASASRASQALGDMVILPTPCPCPCSLTLYLSTASDAPVPVPPPTPPLLFECSVLHPAAYTRRGKKAAVPQWCPRTPAPRRSRRRSLWGRLQPRKLLKLRLRHPVLRLQLLPAAVPPVPAPPARQPQPAVQARTAAQARTAVQARPDAQARPDVQAVPFIR